MIQKTATKTTRTSSKPTAPPVQFYNFRSRQLEPFRPSGTTVGLYSCGPTVYGPAHIGNFRTYIFSDVLRRTLEYFDHEVRQVMNLTDVEDKIITAATEAGLPIAAVTQPQIERFFGDRDRLGIAPADVYLRATDYIPQMITLIERLMNKGLAYQSDGSIYFAIRRFPAYGRLAGLDLTTLKSGARVNQDEYDKEAAEDFVLWKAADAADVAVGAVWDSPWGRGRPGWHIECSAMSMVVLGESFDLHTGAIDLLFPHHENEIAQSEGATGKEFARFFLEGEHLLVEGQKMAKSLGNVLTLSDVTARGFDPLAFRYLTLTAHYRAKLNFTWDSLTAAAETLRGLRRLMYRPAKTVTSAVTGAIDAALADDLDLPRVLALMHTESNPALWERYDIVLGLDLKPVTIRVPGSIQKLLAERETARTAKDFARADALRLQINQAGFEIEDTPDGPVLLPPPLG